jgi:hypothetical protein
MRELLARTAVAICVSSGSLLVLAAPPAQALQLAKQSSPSDELDEIRAVRYESLRDFDCSDSMALTPHTAPGRPLEQHRRYLEGVAPFNGSSYVVADMTANIAYGWGFLGNANGRAQFGVSTRWAIVHPRWEDHDWRLLYNCSEEYYRVSVQVPPIDGSGAGLLGGSLERALEHDPLPEPCKRRGTHICAVPHSGLGTWKPRPGPAT